MNKYTNTSKTCLTPYQLAICTLLALTGIFAVPAALAAKKVPVAAVKPQAVTLDQALPDYVALQATLAGDTLEGVSAQSKSLSEKLAAAGEKSAAESALRLSGLKDLGPAREEFKKLSQAFVTWARKNRPAGFEVYTCSMAKADWVQKQGPIRNPYYGSEMLECGDRVN